MMADATAFDMNVLGLGLVLGTLGDQPCPHNNSWIDSFPPDSQSILTRTGERSVLCTVDLDLDLDLKISAFNDKHCSCNNSNYLFHYKLITHMHHGRGTNPIQCEWLISILWVQYFNDKLFLHNKASTNWFFFTKPQIRNMVSDETPCYPCPHNTSWIDWFISTWLA